MARYFAVSTDAVHSIVRRHREELQTNGLTTLKGPDLHSFELVILTSSKDGAPESYPQGRAHLRLYTRRTVLNIAMLLRDSEVARRVRTYLLDAEESRPAVAVFDPRYDGIDRRVTDLESAMGEVGPVLRELGPVLTRMSHRLEAMDRRLDATNRGPRRDERPSLRRHPGRRGDQAGAATGSPSAAWQPAALTL